MRIFTLFVSCLLLVSCAQQTPLTVEDEKYVFVFKDIQDVNFEHYALKKLNSGKDYFYAKGLSFLGIQFASDEILYGETYIDKNGEEIKLSTGIHISKDIERAKQQFESIKTRSYSKNPIVAEKEIDNKPISDDLWVSKDSNELFIVLRAGDIVYDLQIVGINLRIVQVWPRLSRKFEHLKRLPRTKP